MASLMVFSTNACSPDYTVIKTWEIENALAPENSGQARFRVTLGKSPTPGIIPIQVNKESPVIERVQTETWEKQQEEECSRMKDYGYLLLLGLIGLVVMLNMPCKASGKINDVMVDTDTKENPGVIRESAPRAEVVVTIANSSHRQEFSLSVDDLGKGQVDISERIRPFLGEEASVRIAVDTEVDGSQAEIHYSAFELAEIVKARYGLEIFVQLELVQKIQVARLYEDRAKEAWDEGDFRVALETATWLEAFHSEDSQGNNLVGYFQAEMQKTLASNGFQPIGREIGLSTLQTIALIIGPEIDEDMYYREILKYVNTFPDLDQVILYSYPLYAQRMAISGTLGKRLEVLISYLGDIKISYFTRYAKTQEEVDEIKAAMAPYEQKQIAEFRGAVSFE